MFISPRALGSAPLALRYPSLVGILSLLCATASANDRLTLGFALEQSWDSNLTRNPDSDAEHYSLALASITRRQVFSKQRLGLSLRGKQYRYDQRDDLDVSLFEGDASWQSEWTRRLTTKLSWARLAYQADQFEFGGNDVVAREDTAAELRLGGKQQLQFALGVSQTTQSHSNQQRQNLAFDEDQLFAEMSYHTHNKSSLSVRLREGQRGYSFSNVLPDLLPDPLFGSSAQQSLDYDYQQQELSGVWALSGKTQLSASLARFEREGDINAGVGSQSSLDLSWAASPKINLSLGFHQSQPALGETADSPSDIRTGFMRLQWQPTAKWQVIMEGRYGENTYPERGLEPARDETIISLSPVALRYQFSEILLMRINTQWVDRQSPLAYRDYHYALATVGLALTF